MKIFLAIILTFIPVVATGQEGKVPDKVLQEISKDLSAIYENVQQIYKSQQSSDAKIDIGTPRYWLQQWPQAITTTEGKTHIRAGATTNAKSLTIVGSNESYTVVDKVNDWYAIQLKEPKLGLTSGWINASSVVPVSFSAETKYDWLTGVTPKYGNPQFQKEEVKTKPSGTSEKSITDMLFLKLTKSLSKMRDKYQNDPYVFVKGFTINLSFPPSVNVTFEFRKAGS